MGNVPPFPSSQVREIIVDQLGKLPEELFAIFEPDAFAAASTAQVHRARLHDGMEVAVKVQRPDIRNQMKADMGIMRNAAQNLPSLSEATVKWLNQYRKGRFEVYLDTSGLSAEVNKASLIGRQVVIAVMLVGLIIGSSIATIGIGLSISRASFGA